MNCKTLVQPCVMKTRNEDLDGILHFQKCQQRFIFLYLATKSIAGKADMYIFNKQLK